MERTQCTISRSSAATDEVTREGDLVATIHIANHEGLPEAGVRYDSFFGLYRRQAKPRNPGTMV